MKILLLTLLTIISLNCFTANPLTLTQPTPAQNAKDFLTGFFKTFDEKFSIDECIGAPSIQNSLAKLLEDLKAKKIAAVIADFQNLISEVEKNCPVETLKNYFKLKKAAIEEGYYFTNLQKNYLKVANIVIIEINNKDRNALSIGVACAEIEKLLIYKDEIKHLSFLAFPEFPSFPSWSNTTEILPKLPDIKMDLEGFKKFAKGFLEGVSSVPFDQNICYTSTLDIKIEEIYAMYQRLYAAIKERSASEFYNSVLEIIKLLKTLSNAKANCKIGDLIKSIGVYATPYAGIAKLIYNLATNYSVYYDDFKAVYADLIAMDWQKSGADVGRIASTLLGWKTS